jgi:hypothetical protein
VLHLFSLNVKPQTIRKQVGLTINEVYAIRRKARLLAMKAEEMESEDLDSAHK